jgi:hypothetical protein
MQESEAQREACRRYGAVYAHPMPDEKFGIALATLDGYQPPNGLRHPPERGTCGWYVWAGEAFPTEDDAFAPLHVAHLTEHYPELAPYFGPRARLVRPLSTGLRRRLVRPHTPRCLISDKPRANAAR